MDNTNNQNNDYNQVENPVTTEQYSANVTIVEKKRSGLIITLTIVIILILASAVLAFISTNQQNSDTRESNGTISKNSIPPPTGSKACVSEYEKLLSANAFDFSSCTASEIRTGEYTAQEQSKTHLVLVFDASGSMAGKVDGVKKIDIAKQATEEFLKETGKNDLMEISIVVYGHKGDNTESNKSTSCRGIEEVYPLGPVDPVLAKSKINSFNATGWTPIADSLELASKILSQKPGKENVILLVSDGKETCGGDPVSKVSSLKNSNQKIITSVIGFDVAGEDEMQLKNIAEAGNGDYYSVKSALDLKQAYAKYQAAVDKADFKIGRTIEQLHDISYVYDKYYQCTNMLKREQAVMMLDINESNLTGEACKSYSNETYRNRYNDINQQIKNTFDKDKSTFDALKE